MSASPAAAQVKQFEIYRLDLMQESAHIDRGVGLSREAKLADRELQRRKSQSDEVLDELAHIINVHLVDFFIESERN
jgi:hypothetical protein